MNASIDLVARASAVLSRAKFGQLNPSTLSDYVSISRRLDAQRRESGPAWGGPMSGTDNPGSAYVYRSAWTRRAHFEVGAALAAIHDPDADSMDALRHLQEWLPQAEAYPSVPMSAPGPGGGCPKRKAPNPTSKRRALHSLPSDWMDTLWSAAVSRGFVHLDALAVIITSGCRPSEACYGVGVRRCGDGIEIVIKGAKVREAIGQPWRLVAVAAEDGPAAHLASLAAAKPKGVLVRPDCSPNALSMGISDLASACLPGRRLSAYDIRHQRASDVRATFGDDLEMLAAWLGHVSLSTLRHYGRLPRSGGTRGPTPLSAEAARPILRRSPSMSMNSEQAQLTRACVPSDTAASGA